MESAIGQFFAWWAALPREWAFLFLLPFAIAAAGLLRYLCWRE
jgi:hypothetical protein